MDQDTQRIVCRVVGNGNNAYFVHSIIMSLRFEFSSHCRLIWIAIHDGDDDGSAPHSANRIQCQINRFKKERKIRWIHISFTCKMSRVKEWDGDVQRQTNCKISKAEKRGRSQSLLLLCFDDNSWLSQSPSNKHIKSNLLSIEFTWIVRVIWFVPLRPPLLLCFEWIHRIA